jgi:hypothetical protein
MGKAGARLNGRKNVRHGALKMPRENACAMRAASKGRPPAKDDAIALAQEMIRNGTMPSPQQAKELHKEERHREAEKRAKRPSEIRKRQAREENDRLWHNSHDAEYEEKKAPPFYEIFAEAYDLTDPKLWRSNSFAMIRPRLILEVKTAIAQLEYDVHCYRNKSKPTSWKAEQLAELEPKLARAREILALLDPGPIERKARGNGDTP